jgi:hypothetical protein
MAMTMRTSPRKRPTFRTATSCNKAGTAMLAQANSLKREPDISGFLMYYQEAVKWQSNP